MDLESRRWRLGWSQNKAGEAQEASFLDPLLFQTDEKQSLSSWCHCCWFLISNPFRRSLITVCFRIRYRMAWNSILGHISYTEFRHSRGDTSTPFKNHSTTEERSRYKRERTNRHSQQLIVVVLVFRSPLSLPLSQRHFFSFAVGCLLIRTPSVFVQEKHDNCITKKAFEHMYLFQKIGHLNVFWFFYGVFT